MRTNRSVPDATVIPVLVYPDVERAAAWLVAAFGFVERLRVGEGHRVQLDAGDGAVVVCEAHGDRAAPVAAGRDHEVLVRVEDVAAHRARAAAHGAAVLAEPADSVFGERQYRVEDLAGHRWVFSQTLADVDPAVWGGTVVPAPGRRSRGGGAPRAVAVLGATGRVGRATVELALADGLDVLAVARRPDAVTVRHERLRTTAADATDRASLSAALEGLAPGTPVVMAVGADSLKPSTLVGDTVANLVAVMAQVGLHRYVGISGVVQMPATPAGRVTQFVLRRAIRATADHQRAFDELVASDLDWVVAGCPSIRDGHPAGRAQEHATRFPGGYRVVAPRDVAVFLVRHVRDGSRHREVLGLW